MTMTTKELLALVADWRERGRWDADACADELEAALASDTGERGVVACWRYRDGSWQDGEPTPADLLNMARYNLTPEYAYAALRAQPAGGGGCERCNGSGVMTSDNHDEAPCVHCQPESGGQGEEVKLRRLVDAQRRYIAAFKDGPRGDLNEQRRAQAEMREATAALTQGGGNGR